MRSAVAVLVVGLMLVLAVQAAPASTGVVVFGPTAAAAVPALYDNCTNFNKKYRHGVGKAGARDKTRSGARGVTTFLRSTRIYNIAMKWNDDLDRDGDGVACEKA
jgi:Excalibur calcium-binding domain